MCSRDRRVPRKRRHGRSISESASKKPRARLWQNKGKSTICRRIATSVAFLRLASAVVGEVSARRFPTELKIVCISWQGTSNLPYTRTSKLLDAVSLPQRRLNCVRAVLERQKPFSHKKRMPASASFRTTDEEPHSRARDLKQSPYASSSSKRLIEPFFEI